MIKRKKRRQRNVAPFLISAISLGLGGRNTLIGPDFLLELNDPYNADIGHLDPKDLRTYDQDYVDSLINMKPKRKSVPVELKSISDYYVKQRLLLSDYHLKNESLIMQYDIVAAKELKNFDEYINKVVIRNEAEMVVLYDYITLYRKIENKRAIIYYNLQNPEIINSDNKQVINALEKSNFAILRLDKNLECGAIRVTNIITKQELILVDKALNASGKEGYFFICSLLDMGDYVMTSGGGIPIDSTSPGGKSTLTLTKKHLENLSKAKALNNSVMEAAREIYGFCLRAGALINMTVSEVK